MDQNLLTNIYVLQREETQHCWCQILVHHEYGDFLMVAVGNCSRSNCKFIALENEISWNIFSRLLLSISSFAKLRELLGGLPSHHKIEKSQTKKEQKIKLSKEILFVSLYLSLLLSAALSFAGAVNIAGCVTILQGWLNL